MDYREQACVVIKNIYRYKSNEYKYSKLVLDVCSLFDCARKEELSPADYHFLNFISSQIGIPHYYTLINKLTNHADDEIDLSDVLSNIEISPLIIDNDVMLHLYQKKFIDLYNTNKENRFLLSAPTSFGKTFLVYEIIKKIDYKNVLLVFPTIALMVENYQKVLDLKDKEVFWKDYRLHTLSDDYDNGERNIWIFTPERLLSYLDKNPNQQFDFAFMDEIYKIDNSFIIDTETIGENERDTAFRIALHCLCVQSRDLLLVGPYLSLPSEESNKSFNLFLSDNRITSADYNDVETVKQLYYEATKNNSFNLNESLVKVTTSDKKKNLIRLLPKLKNEETIIYCGTKMTVERRAKDIIKSGVFDLVNYDRLTVFINHLLNRFPNDWIVSEALKYGIGIHHGLVPKYVQKEIISLFNDGIVHCILSTTTITEGVNTSAKNMVVLDSMKGKKKLKRFDAQNIAGRAGRFTHHFSGRVISLDNEFARSLKTSDGDLEHRDYDYKTPKSDADLEICKSQYLNEADKERKRLIKQRVEASNLPDYVLNSFKTISKIKKVDMFSSIANLEEDKINKISEMCLAFSERNCFIKKGFQYICDLLTDFIDESSFKGLFTAKVNDGDYSVITSLVSSYLHGGFHSMVKYCIEVKNENADTAMRRTANYVYNIFKYQLVKYLGIFDNLFRYFISQKTGKSYDEVVGLGKIIKRIENGYLSKKANAANDFGVPYALLDYYEGKVQSTKGFDPYEIDIFNKVEKYID